MYVRINGSPNSLYRNILMKTLTVSGFLVSDYAERFGESLEALGQWIAEGKIKFKVDVVEGIENAPGAFLNLFSGDNFGKMLVRL